MFLLAVSKAVTKDVGLIATFGGIGVIATLIMVAVAVQVRGEHRQNRQYNEH